MLRPVAIEIAENAIRSSSLWTERRADLEELAREEVSLEFHGQDDAAAPPDFARGPGRESPHLALCPGRAYVSSVGRERNPA